MNRPARGCRAGTALLLLIALAPAVHADPPALLGVPMVAGQSPSEARVVAAANRLVDETASCMLLGTLGLANRIKTANDRAAVAASRRYWVTAAEQFQLADDLYSSAARVIAGVHDAQTARQAWANVMDTGGLEEARSQMDSILREAVTEKTRPIFTRVEELNYRATVLMRQGRIAEGEALQNQAIALSTAAKTLIQTPRASYHIILSNIDLSRTPEALRAQLDTIRAKVSTIRRDVTVQCGTGPAVVHTQENAGLLWNSP